MERVIKSEVKNFSFFYKDKKVINRVSFPLFEKQITALIGPSGCGKSTLLRSFNRMHDLYKGHTTEGEIILYPEKINLLDPKYDPTFIRMRIGMVFQKPNPFPKSIFENVVYGLRIRGVKKNSILEEKCEKALRQAGLWNEVKDRLKQSALSLSGGQQQRLCIARALAVDPEMLLLDEPSSALDPLSVSHIENLLCEIKNDVTILIVTHNLHQAARISEYTIFMYLGELIEFNETRIMFTNPKHHQTEKYITGHFG